MNKLKKLWNNIKKVLCCCFMEQEILEKVEVKKIKNNNLDIINNYIDDYWDINREKKIRFSGINYKSRSLKYFNNYNISLETIVEDPDGEERESLLYLILRILEEVS